MHNNSASTALHWVAAPLVAKLLMYEYECKFISSSLPAALPEHYQVFLLTFMRRFRCTSFFPSRRHRWTHGAAYNALGPV